MNQCNFIGRLGNDPEERGKSVRLSLAIRNWNNRTREAETMWVTAFAFGPLSESIMKNRLAKKGALCRITGQLRLSEYKGSVKPVIWVDQFEILLAQERTERPAKPKSEEEEGSWLDDSDDDEAF